MPRGGYRRNAGRPPGARNKPKATASPRPSAKRLKLAKAMDALQLTMSTARELYAKGELSEAGKMAAKALPYTVQRYGVYRGEAPRSPEQAQLDLPLPAPAVAAAAGDEKPDDGWSKLLQ